LPEGFYHGLASPFCDRQEPAFPSAGVKTNQAALQLFAGSMATCLASGLPPQKALELSGSRVQSEALRETVRTAAAGCAQGLPISEALAPGANNFPRHFLPVVHAGEVSGHQAEAFQLLYQHSVRIAPTLRVVRNTWLYPLICIVFGWIIRTGCYLYFGKYLAAWQFVESTFGTALLLALAGWMLFQLPVIKKTLDALFLQIPILRETQIRMTVVLFFSTFRLAYEAGGLPVVRMFDLALATVGNEVLREDLEKAREVLTQGGTIGAAFDQPDLLEDDFKSLISTGSLSGKLDECFTHIVEQATWQLELTLQAFNQIFQRVIAFSVVMSIVETVFICLQ
jgi:type IV pilus assembly protein PilC